MTRSEVERHQRTASRPVHVPPAGVPAILLPASQGVEERPGRSADRAALRIGLRTLVIGGFAGAAWLLSGAAAQASGPYPPAEPATGGVSVVSLVNGPGNGAVEGPLTTASKTGHRQSATRPLAATASTLLGDACEPADRATSVALPCSTTAGLTPVTTARPASQPVGTAGSRTDKPADRAPTASAVPAYGGDREPGSGPGGATAGGGLVGLVPQLAAPLRPVDATASLSGLLAPVTTVTNPVLDQLLPTRRPVTDLLRDVAAPVTATLGQATAATGRPTTEPDTDTPSRASAPDGVAADSTPRTGVAAQPDAHRVTRSGTDRAASAQQGPASAGIGGSVRRSAGADDRAGTPAARTGADPAPEGPRPAPLRAYLGTGNGVSTGGSSCPSDGGAFATVASSVADSTVARHRLPITTDVAVRRYDAEAPTVSPD